jgi:hypothetical protein
MNKKLLLPLGLVAFLGIAATTYTITQLTANTSPSDGTIIEVYDPSASPKSGKYLLTNLIVKSSSALVAGDGTEADQSDVSVALGYTAQDASAPVVDVQNYIALGSPTTNTVYTWSKPTNAKRVRVICIGGGGGGGSGRVGDAGGDRWGGGGGSGGNWSTIDIDATLLGLTETVTVGAGGGGGAVAGVAAGNGNAGAAGGHTSFGSWCSAGGGGAGAGGSAANGTAGAVNTANGLTFSGAIGGAGAAGAAGAGGNVTSGFAAAGGAGGGGISSADAVGNGGTGGAVRGPTVTINGGSGAAGGDGTSRTAYFPYGGAGGGGGPSSKTANATAGGKGGLYGGGGGGGGAGLTTFNSGKGGDGADGIVVVITEISPSGPAPSELLGYGLLSSIDTTNYVLNASGDTYPEINAADNVNFAHCTNGPGVATVTIYPGTANRTISMPTNWFWLSTNGFSLSGGLYSLTLNSNSIAVLTAKKRSGGASQTNVISSFKISE